MFDVSSALSFDARAQLAFDLLASSSVGRYVRVARGRAAEELAATLALRGIGAATLVNTARRLWAGLLTRVERSEQEVDLAALLAVLASRAGADVDVLLRQIGLVDRRPVTWLAALARTLRQSRPSSQTASFEVRTVPGVSGRSMATDSEVVTVQPPYTLRQDHSRVRNQSVAA